MRVFLRPQQRTVEVSGRRTVAAMLRELGILPGTAMVIRGDLLLLDTEMLDDEDDVEVRAVISGGGA
jgi:sulfur carrier protein ThiS